MRLNKLILVIFVMFISRALVFARFSEAFLTEYDYCMALRRSIIDLKEINNGKYDNIKISQNYFFEFTNKYRDSFDKFDCLSIIRRES